MTKLLIGKEKEMLKSLQAQLPKMWTGDFYSDEFKESPSKHKDFQHAILHVTKALGKLSSMVEEVDHMGGPKAILYFPKPEVEKYLADLVICALRMAIKNPTGEIDLEEAVLARIEEKKDVLTGQ